MIKNTFGAVGLKVEWRDRLAETIPKNYERSDFLPRIYRQNVERLLYMNDMVARVRGVPGDVVECGVSIGHGLLIFILLNELLGTTRTYYGFDSFEGFPAPTGQDGATHAYKGYYANPPEIVLKVLREGRVSEETIRKRVRLVSGFFDQSLPSYGGQIALLHLDCDLYDSYVSCLTHLYSKVIAGGLIMFDEYEQERFPGAKKAVDEFFADKPEIVESHPSGKYFIVKA